MHFVEIPSPTITVECCEYILAEFHPYLHSRDGFVLFISSVAHVSTRHQPPTKIFHHVSQFYLTFPSTSLPVYFANIDHLVCFHTLHHTFRLSSVYRLVPPGSTRPLPCRPVSGTPHHHFHIYDVYASCYQG